jgi:hypothetical protein
VSDCQCTLGLLQDYTRARSWSGCWDLKVFLGYIGRRGCLYVRTVTFLGPITIALSYPRTRGSTVQTYRMSEIVYSCCFQKTLCKKLTQLVGTPHGAEWPGVYNGPSCPSFTYGIRRKNENRSGRRKPSEIRVTHSTSEKRYSCTGVLGETRHPLRSWESGCADARKPQNSNFRNFQRCLNYRNTMISHIDL